jgi:uncharacterized protein
MLEVKIFLEAEDLYKGKRMDEYILRYLMHHRVRGATSFVGSKGFGEHHHLNEPGQIGASDALPVMLVFVDEESRVQQVLPHLKEVIGGGLITVHKVDVA